MCVPIPIEDCEDFDPSSPPTVPQLVQELNRYDATLATSGDDSNKLQGLCTGVFQTKETEPFTRFFNVVLICFPLFIAFECRLAEDVASEACGIL